MESPLSCERKLMRKIPHHSNRSQFGLRSTRTCSKIIQQAVKEKCPVAWKIEFLCVKSDQKIGRDSSRCIWVLQNLEDLCCKTFDCTEQRMEYFRCLCTSTNCIPVTKMRRVCTELIYGPEEDLLFRSNYCISEHCICRACICLNLGENWPWMIPSLVKVFTLLIVFFPLPMMLNFTASSCDVLLKCLLYNALILKSAWTCLAKGPVSFLHNFMVDENYIDLALFITLGNG